MDKKYQVFISSTYSDLIEERKAVQEVILSMYQFPIGMEMFSAADEEQWEIIKETIDSSDYYILIIGHRYGSTTETDDGEIISYTEKEYRYAKENGIPILAFIIDDSVPILLENIENDENMKKHLFNFIEEVKTGRMVEWWTDTNDLKTKVALSLHKQINRKKRSGWIRADSFDIDGLQRELLKLTQKARELEEENTLLKQRTSDKIPNLSLSINDCEVIYLTLYENIYNSIDADFSPISIDMVPVQTLDTPREIEEFNQSLPSKEELEQYKNEYLWYERATEHSTELKLQILNDGNIKANDVNIEIKFPKEIIVLEKSAIKEMKLPAPPKTARNPMIPKWTDIDLAYLSELKNSYWSSSVGLDVLRLENSANIHKQLCFNDDNSISIWIDSLLHKYTSTFEDRCCIVPTQRGEFEILCEFMCEEYDDIEIKKIKVIVE